MCFIWDWVSFPKFCGNLDFARSFFYDRKKGMRERAIRSRCLYPLCSLDYLEVVGKIHVLKLAGLKRVMRKCPLVVTFETYLKTDFAAHSPIYYTYPGPSQCLSVEIFFMCIP